MKGSNNNDNSNSNNSDKSNKNVLHIISSALKDLRKGKKRAKSASRRKKQEHRRQKQANNEASWYDSISTSCSESVCSSEADHVPEENNSGPAKLMQRLSDKAAELQQEVKSSLNSYTNKEVVLSKAITFHMDRAKGRHDSGNMKGCLLSLRKLKALQQEHQHVIDATQYFSFRQLELDRFRRDIQTQLQDEQNLDSSSLEQQALHICTSLDDGMLRNILQEPNVHDSVKKTSDEELLKELTEHMSDGSSSPNRVSYDEDDEDDNASIHSSGSEEDDDDSEFSLSEEDEGLVRDIMVLNASSSSMKLS